jgi:hypothetical protein
MVQHFNDYSVGFIARFAHPDPPDTNHHVIAQFAAHGSLGLSTHGSATTQ